MGPAFPTLAQPTLLRIWQEAHGKMLVTFVGWVKCVIVKVAVDIVLSAMCFILVHRDLVSNICVSALRYHWFQWRLVACSVPIDYLYQHWPIKIRPLRTNIADIWIKKVFISKSAVWKILTILSSVVKYKISVKLHIPVKLRGDILIHWIIQ